MTDWSGPSFDVHSRSFFFFFFSSVSRRSEKKEDLPTILSVLLSLFFFFVFFLTLLLPHTHRLFPLGCRCKSAKAFLFVVSPTPSARSLARAAIASSNVADTASFFFFFFVEKLKQTSSRAYICVCLLFCHILEVYA
jgi:hypothetical protein